MQRALVEALLAIIDAARAYCRRAGSARRRSSPGCFPEATDNPRIIAALAAHVIQWQGTSLTRSSPGRRRSFSQGRVLDRLSVSGGGVSSIDQSAVGPLRAVR